MLALITGASSGIGKAFAIELSNRGYDLILVARDKSKLNNVKKQLKTNVEVISLDLQNIDNCKKLYNMVNYKNIDLLINNAGFGLVGLLSETSLEKELDMIDLNVKSLHTLTKLFLNDFIKKDSGHILNVSSVAAFQPGPLMATYYGTKSYVYNFTLALYEELRYLDSNVRISCLCPGPVDTNFNNVAGCEFKLKSLSSDFVARYAINKTLKGKLLIIPGYKTKLVYLFGRLMPNKLKLKILFRIQKRKIY